MHDLRRHGHDALHRLEAGGGRRRTDGHGRHHPLPGHPPLPEVLRGPAEGPGPDKRYRGGDILRPRRRPHIQRHGGGREEVRRGERQAPLVLIQGEGCHGHDAAAHELHKQPLLRRGLRRGVRADHGGQHRIRRDRGLHRLRQEVQPARGRDGGHRRPDAVRCLCVREGFRHPVDGGDGPVPRRAAHRTRQRQGGVP